MEDYFHNEFVFDKDYKVQNFLKSSAPDFCPNPYWYIQGLEKKVKIGYKSFNSIDYLEAYCNIDCGTHCNYEYLDKVYKEIQKAFEEVENYKKTGKTPPRKYPTDPATFKRTIDKLFS